jgi:tetratricopeptide (TPR) repeat protein
MIRIRSGVAALATALALTFPSDVPAASTGGGADRERDTGGEEAEGPDEADQLYARGMELAEEGKFEEALVRFEQAGKKRKKDPEILNMLAFCQRKTGDLESAFENYARALEIKPKFPQAREYLAEAHLQAALAQLEILRGYAPEGEQERAELVAAIRRMAAEVAAEPGSEGGGDW